MQRTARRFGWVGVARAVGCHGADHLDRSDRDVDTWARDVRARGLSAGEAGGVIRMGDVISGELVLTLGLGSAIALPVTAVLLVLFKRAVIRGMHSRAGGPDATPVTAAPRGPRPPRVEPKGTFREANSSLIRTLAAYLLATVAFITTMALAQIVAGGYLLTWRSLVLVGSWYTLPLVFVLLSVLPRGSLRLASLGVYAALMALVLTMVAIVSPDDVLGVLGIWGRSAIYGLLLVPFATRRLRAAGPLVLVFAVVGVAGANALYSLSGGFMLGVGEAAVGFWSNVTGGVAPVSFLGWAVLLAFDLVGGLIGIVVGRFVLMIINNRYRRKRFSDQALFVDTVFVWFAVLEAARLSALGAEWLLAGLVAFLAYKVVAKVGLAFVSKAPPHGHRDLLLLRPFSLGRRSERLFDNMSKVWLRGGPVHMIAGPDLVVSTVAPTEFLAFLSGRMRRLFISDEAGLADHLANLDVSPDPDGRYRVNQLFCSDDVWQGAMRALAARCDVILMDLRGLTAANQGCLYELEVLIRGVALRRVHFAVDATTDRTFLDSAVASLWEQLPADAPNRPYGGIASRIIWVDDKPKSREQLLEVLMRPLAPAS